MIKIDHIAIACTSVEESDKFFMDLLGLNKIREFIVSEDLMEKFFHVRKDQQVIRYSNQELSAEIFITEKGVNHAKDTFSHTCLLIENRDLLIEKANLLGFEVIKVTREGSDNYYLFIRGASGNLFEIKSP